jgi:hypothetical protein
VKTAFQSQFWRSQTLQLSARFPSEKIVSKIREIKDKSRDGVFLIPCGNLRNMGVAVKFFCDAFNADFMSTEEVSIWHVIELSSIDIAYNRFSDTDTSINTFLTPLILSILDVGYETREVSSFIRYLLLIRKYPILLVSSDDRLIIKKYLGQNSITVIEGLGL